MLRGFSYLTVANGGVIHNELPEIVLRPDRQDRAQVVSFSLGRDRN